MEQTWRNIQEMYDIPYNRRAWETRLASIGHNLMSFVILTPEEGVPIINHFIQLSLNEIENALTQYNLGRQFTPFRNWIFEHHVNDFNPANIPQYLTQFRPQPIPERLDFGAGIGDVFTGTWQGTPANFKEVGRIRTESGRKIPTYTKKRMSKSAELAEVETVAKYLAELVSATKSSERAAYFDTLVDKFAKRYDGPDLSYKPAKPEVKKYKMPPQLEMDFIVIERLYKYFTNIIEFGDKKDEFKIFVIDAVKQHHKKFPKTTAANMYKAVMLYIDKLIEGVEKTKRLTLTNRSFL